VAHLRCDFFSDTLGLSTSMTVLLPEPGPSRLPPVLYLLHGLTDDDTAWLRNTSIERYVADLGLAVVMPQVHRSFYTDETVGGRYWHFVCDELPATVSSFFRLSRRREDTFVAGLSMGGYGALKLALRHPERYAAAASLSGALDLRVSAERARPEDPRMFERIFGGPPPDAGEDDLFWLLRTGDPATRPPLYIACGTDDELIEANRRFRDAGRELGATLQVDFGPGGHDWAYWDAGIRDVLSWLPLPVAANGYQDVAT
jgi:S-formylglutathione hydrolase FrmB